jgi:hypothetical protein
MLKELGFDQIKIDSCVSATDEEFGISDAYADKSTWRGSFPSFGIYEEETLKWGSGISNACNKWSSDKLCKGF